MIDGPFTETKELVAGFWLWQVKSMDEAIAWVKRRPNPMISDSEIEIRPVFSPEDFGAALTPDLKDQEERICAAVERLPSNHGVLSRGWGPNGRAQGNALGLTKHEIQRASPLVLA